VVVPHTRRLLRAATPPRSGSKGGRRRRRAVPPDGRARPTRAGTSPGVPRAWRRYAPSGVSGSVAIVCVMAKRRPFRASSENGTGLFCASSAQPAPLAAPQPGAVGGSHLEAGYGRRGPRQVTSRPCRSRTCCAAHDTGTAASRPT
jgi:hypothetical protein